MLLRRSSMSLALAAAVAFTSALSLRAAPPPKPSPAPAPTTPAPAAPATAARPTLLVLETASEAAYREKVRAYGDLLATILEPRIDGEIVPASSVRDRLSVAASKIEAGCDDVSCMSEIAGALDARFVVASRASQVGGRWLMRVELFDSRDLKVIAQASAMSDSVEGLASKAESLADDILAKAPSLKKGASSSTATNTGYVREVDGDDERDQRRTPKPDPRNGPGMTPWLVGGLTGAAAVGVTALHAWSFFDARAKEQRLERVLADYNDDPADVDTRKDLVEAGQAADNASTLNNCLVAPIGCLCLPLAAGSIASFYWGFSAPAEDEK